MIPSGVVEMFRRLWLPSSAVPPKPILYTTGRRSSKWPALEKRLIAAHPFCSWCGSRHDLVGHHILPYHVNPSLELSEENIQIVCEGKGFNCHWALSHLRSWLSWNVHCVPQAAVMLKEIQNRPSLTKTSEMFLHMF